jgi:hypothetical protein
MPLPVRQRCQDCIQNVIESFADILRQKPQNEISVLLQESILPTISPVRFGIGQVLRAVEFDHDTTVRVKEVHLHSAPAIESDR